MRYCGREFIEAEVELIRQLLAQQHGPVRTL